MTTSRQPLSPLGLSLILLFAATLVSPAFARKGNPREDTAGRYDWKLQYPERDFTTPQRLYAINDHVVYLLCNGFLMRSVDSGATWDSYDLPGCFKVNSAAFYGDSLVWLVGDVGAIYKSTNGGQEWKLYLLDWKQDLRYVNFSSPLIGWVGGRYGSVLKTTDGGVNWQFKNYWNFFDVTAVSDVQSIAALSDSVVWVAHISIVVNNFIPLYKVDIVRTTDGGETWDSMYYRWVCHSWINKLNPELSGGGDDIIDVSNILLASPTEASFMAPADTAIWDRTVSPPRIARYDFVGWTRWSTTNGGATWDSVSMPKTAVCRYPKMFTPSVGWGSGIVWRKQEQGSTRIVDSVINAKLYRSTDRAGQTWKLRNTPLNTEVLPELYDFIDTLIGWCYVNNGNGTTSVYRTIDGAVTWHAKSTYPISSGTLLGVTFINADSGWAVGKTSSRKGIVMGTSDRGKHWNVLNASIPDTLKQVQFVDNLNGWAMGDTLYVTHDAGVTWTADPRFPNDSLRPSVHYVLVQFVTPQIGWILRSDWLTFRTTNAGTTWTAVHNADTATRISVGYAPGAHTLLAMGKLSNEVEEFRLLDAGNRSQSFEIGVSGTTPSNPPGMPQALCFIDSLRGWMVDTAANMFSTDDAGESWTFITANPDLRVTNQILFTDTANGWFLKGVFHDVSTDPLGKVYRTPFPSGVFELSEGGFTWDEERCIQRELRSMAFVGDTLGWAVGENLCVYHYYVPRKTPIKRAPFMVLSPPTIDFGVVRPGLYATDSIAVHNEGNDTLRIYGADVSAGAARTFNLATLVPLNVLPGDSVMLGVHFNPKFYQSFEDTMNVYSNDDTQQVYLRGIGDEPVDGVGSTFGSLGHAWLNVYPNPFISQTTIEYGTASSHGEMPSHLLVSDMYGRVVADLTEAAETTGDAVRFDANSLPNGVYCCSAQFSDRTVTGRLVLLR